MRIAIDTSTAVASLALVREETIFSEMTWLCAQNHAVELFPRLNCLMEQARLTINNLDGIIVARGPGSFNGLRVGVSAAKGMAFSLGIPIVGVSTLEATAYQHADSGLPVCAIQMAGREEIAIALYQRKRGLWSQMATEHLTTVEALPLEISQKTIFCGEISPVSSTKIKQLFKSKAILPGPAAQFRRAAFLAELGCHRIESGDLDNPATLQPVYLRRPHITQRKQRNRG